MVATAALNPDAQAAFSDSPGTRPLGMGGALRGAATGSAGPALNPSGMTLLRAYVVEGAYTYARQGKAHEAQASIVDSTSAFNLAGGVFYNYLDASPDGGIHRSGHEGGVALAIPFGDRFSLGATAKYLRVDEGSPVQKVRGVTFDIGMTLRPIGTIGIGLVAHNLRDLDTARAPRAIGGGLSFAPTSSLLLVGDVVAGLEERPGGERPLWVMGGAEYQFARQFGFRAGAGRRGDAQRGYVSGGLSFMSEVGAVDLGMAHDVSGSAGKETVFGVSARLFVPGPGP